MAVRIVCDCCDCATEAPVALGVVRPRHYCPECLPKAQTYVDERDAAHTAVARTWQAKRDALAKKHEKSLKLMPDVA